MSGGNDWRRGAFPDTGATDIEALCSAARQLAQLVGQIVYILENWEADRNLARLVALARLDLASYPMDHQPVTIEITKTPIAHNVYEYPTALLLTNHDNAQILYYGAGSVTTVTGGILDPLTSTKIILPAGAELFGIVAGPGTVAASVSTLGLPNV